MPKLQQTQVECQIIWLCVFLMLTIASARVAVTAQSAQPDTYYCHIASVNFHRFPFHAEPDAACSMHAVYIGAFMQATSSMRLCMRGEARKPERENIGAMQATVYGTWSTAPVRFAQLPNGIIYSALVHKPGCFFRHTTTEANIIPGPSALLDYSTTTTVSLVLYCRTP